MSSSSDTPDVTGAPIEIDVVGEAGDRPTLVVRGEIDVSTSPELRAQLGRFLDGLGIILESGNAVVGRGLLGFYPLCPVGLVVGPGSVVAHLLHSPRSGATLPW